MAGGEASRRSHGRDPRAASTDGMHFVGPDDGRTAAHMLFARRRLLPLVTITTASRARSYAIHPMLWLGGVSVAAILAVGAIGAGVYQAFHDDILQIAITRPIRMEQAYEDRIAALRSEIDRINSRQLLDQDTFEAKIAKLMSRQEELRAEEARVAGLLTKAHDQNIHIVNGAALVDAPGQLGGDLAVPSNMPSAGPSAAGPVPMPQPIENTPLRSTWLFGLGQPRLEDRLADQSAPALKIARIEAELNRMKATEMASIASIAGLAETSSHTIERVVGRLGLHMAVSEVPSAPMVRADGATRGPQHGTDAGVGGPLEPILAPSEILTRAETALARLNQLKTGIGLLPLGQPISGQIEITSPFGERADPFLGVPAMHTGADLRAGQGDPVVATGAGVVTEASRQGGYGNLVEIDHGNGIQTRYGHLSLFAVVVGERVKAGHIIGYVGSTGRSTAPHLHYETRVNGVAVNPEAYLAAGNQLRPLLN